MVSAITQNRHIFYKSCSYCLLYLHKTKITWKLQDVECGNTLVDSALWIIQIVIAIVDDSCNRRAHYHTLSNPNRVNTLVRYSRGIPFVICSEMFSCLVE